MCISIALMGKYIISKKNDIIVILCIFCFVDYFYFSLYNFLSGGKDLKNKFENKQKPYRITFLILLVTALTFFTIFYFSTLLFPGSGREVILLSDKWQLGLEKDEEVISFSYLLTEPMPAAHLMIKAGQQNVKAFLEEEAIYDSSIVNKGEDFSHEMHLHWIELPQSCQGKTLIIQMKKPPSKSGDYSANVFLGNLLSLENYVVSRSVLPLLLMGICTVLGFLMISLAIYQFFKGEKESYSNLYLGIFSILWGMYFPTTEYIVHQLFPPDVLTAVSLGLYYIYPLPMIAYFWSKMMYYRKVLFLALILRISFIILASFMYIGKMAPLGALSEGNHILVIMTNVTIVSLLFLERKKENAFAQVTFPGILIAFILSVLNVTLYYIDRMMHDRFPYEISLFLLLMTLWGYTVWQYIVNRTKERIEHQTTRIKNQLVAESYEKQSQSQEQIHILLHEKKTHVLAMQILMRNGEYKKLESYLDSIAEQHERIPPHRYCSNALLNSLLSVRLFNLKEMGIEVTYTISVPEEIAVPEEDLVSLILNILDNAVEALKMVPQDLHRALQISIRQKGHYLYIECINSKTNQVQQDQTKFISGKADKQYHGYGLKIIEDIVKKRQGMLNIEYSDLIFAIYLAIRTGKS